MRHCRSRRYERAYCRALIEIYEGRYYGDGSDFSRSRVEQDAYADAIVHVYGNGLGGGPRQANVIYQRGYAGGGGLGPGWGGPGYGYGGGGYGMHQCQPLASPINLVLHATDTGRDRIGELPTAAAVSADDKGAARATAERAPYSTRRPPPPMYRDDEPSCCTVM